MLVLSRKRCESITIAPSDEPVVICITDIDGDKVKVGVTAPKHVRVMRSELLDRDGNEVPRA